MKTFKFELTEQEAQFILDKLGALPFNDVAGLIFKFQDQVRSQMMGETTPAVEEPTEEPKTTKK